MRVNRKEPLNSAVTVGARVPASNGPAGVSLELEVVNGGDWQQIPVQDLAIEKMQPGVDQSFRHRRRIRRWRQRRLVSSMLVRGAHEPAPVTISRGIAATEATTMMTR